MFMFVKKRPKSQFLLWNRWLDRHRIVSNMETFCDIIVIALCFCLFAVMIIKLWGIFNDILYSFNYQLITAQMLFILILVELFRLLMVYLQEHSIAVGVAVEVTIVSLLREVIVHGALEISGIQVASICGLLIILGVLLLICAKTPHMDCMSANTKYCPFIYGEENQQSSAECTQRRTSSHRDRDSKQVKT